MTKRGVPNKEGREGYSQSRNGEGNKGDKETESYEKIEEAKSEDTRDGNSTSETDKAESSLKGGELNANQSDSNFDLTQGKVQQKVNQIQYTRTYNIPKKDSKLSVTDEENKEYKGNFENPFIIRVPFGKI